MSVVSLCSDFLWIRIRNSISGMVVSVPCLRLLLGRLGRWRRHTSEAGAIWSFLQALQVRVPEPVDQKAPLTVSQALTCADSMQFRVFPARRTARRAVFCKGSLPFPVLSCRGQAFQQSPWKLYVFWDLTLKVT